MYKEKVKTLFYLHRTMKFSTSSTWTGSH